MFAVCPPCGRNVLLRRRRIDRTDRDRICREAFRFSAPCAGSWRGVWPQYVKLCKDFVFWCRRRDYKRIGSSSALLLRVLMTFPNSAIKRAAFARGPLVTARLITRRAPGECDRICWKLCGCSISAESPYLMNLSDVKRAMSTIGRSG